MNRSNCILLISFLLAYPLIESSFAATVSGQVRNDFGNPITGARLTLFDPRTNYFRETRSSIDGRYSFANVLPAEYRLGASFPGREYVEIRIPNTGLNTSRSFVLRPETQKGRWKILKKITGNTFGGTDSGVLLPDGRLMYCHDTLDPIILDPVRNAIVRPPASPRRQGCHAVTLLGDGRSIYVGGTDVEVFGPGTRQVKTFNPLDLTWKIVPDMVMARWYPTMVQLSDGKLLAIGGGGTKNPQRVKTSEIFDPATLRWHRAGDIAIPNEVSPVVLLLTGEVLMTHRPPQLFNPQTERWRLAADFLQGKRMPNADHSDHEIVLLQDGRVVAVGYKSFTPGVVGNVVEIYNPIANSWRLGANFRPVRSRSSILLMPDQKVLVIGGYKEDPNDPAQVNPWGYMKLTDSYDPIANRWRRLKNMSYAREYHALPILVPDGRVIVVGGEGQPGVEPNFNAIEAFEPPYLFRGIRPEIKNLQQNSVRRGGSISFTIEKTNRPTRIILIGTSARTHFMDSGNARNVNLKFVQSGRQVTAYVPQDAVKVPAGYYILFAMVDDIPSRGIIIPVSA